MYPSYDCKKCHQLYIVSSVLDFDGAGSFLEARYSLWVKRKPLVENPKLQENFRPNLRQKFSRKTKVAVAL